MTIYEKNYRERLTEMMNIIREKYGENHNITEFFQVLYNKYLEHAYYDNREIMEKYFKKFTQNA